MDGALRHAPAEGWVARQAGVVTSVDQCYNRRVFTRTRIALLLIVLLAFGLRVYRLDWQSIWYDEGLSIYLAQQSPEQTIALSAMTDHPPLHALLLGLWMRIAGESDFVVRFLSVFFGVLVVALVFALGQIFDRRVGLMAAFLAAIAPMAIYYSQETRGYMVLTTLILIATMAFIKLMTGTRRRRAWIAYIGAISTALYTHYFAAFAWAALLLASAVLLPAYRRPLRHWLSWGAAQAVIVLLFVPWLPNAIAQAGSNATYFPGRVTWETVVGDTWRAFTVGEWGDASIVGWAWLGLIVTGLTMAMIHRRDAADAEESRPKLCVSGVITLLSLVVIPLLMMSALAWLKPKFAPRYLLPSLPALIVLAAISVAQLIDILRSRYRFIASIGLIVSLTLPVADSVSLLRLYTDPLLARPDVRSVAGYIEAHGAPSDAIVLVGGHQAPAFNHYYRGSAEVIPMPPDLLPAAQSPLDAHAIAQLADIAAVHPRIWLVLWQNEISDPTDVILDELIAQGNRQHVGRNFIGMGLMLFSVPNDFSYQEAPARTVHFPFTQPIRLVAYSLNTPGITAGESIRFGLYLEAEGSITGNYQVFTHLLGADGSLIAQDDHIAGADSYPTSLWHRGNVFINRFEITTPRDLASGEYQVEVGLYDSSGRLKLVDGSDHINLFKLKITR